MIDIPWRRKQCAAEPGPRTENKVTKQPDLMHFIMHRQKTTTTSIRNIFPSENHHSFLATESCMRKWEENRLSAQCEQRSQRCHSAHYFRSREHNFSRHARALFQKKERTKQKVTNRIGNFWELLPKADGKAHVPNTHAHTYTREEGEEMELKYSDDGDSLPAGAKSGKAPAAFPITHESL